MNSRRTTVGLAVALCAVTALPVSAAKPKPKPKPKPPVCNLITDAPNDAGYDYNTAGAPTYDPSLDIVSADVGTNAKNMLATVIRVKHLQKANNLAPLGQTWQIQFVVSNDPDHPVVLPVSTSPLGTKAFVNAPNGSTTVVDEAASEIRVTIPFSKLSAHIINGKSLFQQFYVQSAETITYDRSMGAGEGLAVSTADAASSSSKTTYLAGTPSCVKFNS